jgi:hypothetical protein
MQCAAKGQRDRDLPITRDTAMKGLAAAVVYNDVCDEITSSVSSKLLDEIGAVAAITGGIDISKSEVMKDLAEQSSMMRMAVTINRQQRVECVAPCTLLSVNIFE